MPFTDPYRTSKTIYGDYYDAKLLGTASATDQEKSVKQTSRSPVREYKRASTSTANYNDPVAGLGFET